MPRTRRDSASLDLFADAARHGDEKALRFPLPDQRRFPTNLGSHRVALPVEDDLRQSTDPLIITGYAALDRLIVFCGNQTSAKARVVFGHEPFPAAERSYRLDDVEFPREVEDYWLQQNISLLHSAALLHTIELLKTGAVRARYVHGGTRLHAKIYVGDDAATLGSSNFTDPGMDRQPEANARFERSSQQARYTELRNLAENYWAIGRDYNNELIALLQKLLRFVDWREALARACAELLEGEWAEQYLRGDYLSEADKLWPSQRQGIAQALTVISNHDSVLIADATGAGKTRMGAYLIGAIRDDILRRGRMRNRGNTVMVCPPSVIENWEREKQASGVSMEVYSHGGLSHQRSAMHEIKTEALRRAQVLCVDEGHNFLNLKTQRTQLLLRNLADHVVMLTATPINRSVTDLLRIADMLGADNLEPSTLKAFERMLGHSRLPRTLSDDEVAQLRSEIRKFTVRRTKAMLNKLIEREPEKYTDRLGNPCRFPRHDAKVYKLDEPRSDRDIAERIRSLAETLHGVTHFEHPIQLPLALRQAGVTEQSYLSGRLNGARKLVQYLVRSSLRSSRAALIEHIEGTSAATAAYDIANFRKANPGGDMISRLKRLAGSPPKIELSDDVAVPEWLRDEEAHRQACEQDIATYREIAQLCRDISGQREERKAQQLRKLLKQHNMVLAFDSRPITLAVIRKHLSSVSEARILMGWSEDETSRKALLRAFAPDGDDARNVIGLCSDSLAEGVNLQRASALLHLDMPTVVRVAEQRAGRVDRLDTAHQTIEVWWPEDGPEFQLTTDEKFVQRYDTVERLLGANMPLPENLREPARPITPEAMIEEYEKSAAEPWDGLDDAFSPARGLIHGPHALVAEDVYERYRKVSERVLSRVSLVKSRTPWAFFCLTAGAFEAPRWLMLPAYNAPPIYGLAEVVAALRDRLGPEIQTIHDHEAGAGELERFVRRLSTIERMLLSRKKQRALDELEHILGKLEKIASEGHRQASVDFVGALKGLLQKPDPERQPDWDALATRWLDLIRPVWFKKLESPRRTKPLLLKDLRKDLLTDPEWLEGELIKQFREVPLTRSLDRRIRACIVGVSE